MTENSVALNTVLKNLSKLPCQEEKQHQKRKILPDPKFGNLKVAKFMNQIMTDGKKSVAEKIIYGALMKLQKNLIKSQ